MFIKEIKKRNKNSDKSYIHLRLVESYRTDKGPRHRNVLHLGALSLDKEKWKSLANAIENYLNGKVIFDIDDEVNSLAIHYSEIIRVERLNQSKKVDSEDKTKEFHSVDINTISTSDIKSIGAESVISSQMNDYNFDKILSDLKFTKKEINYTKMLILGKICNPGSERDIARWLKKDSGIQELLNTKENIYDNALHRISTKIYNNKEKLEELLAKEGDVFSPDDNIILYDLTNTYFEGRLVDSEIAKYGNSKEKRHDAPLVTLALIVDSNGFPKGSEILKGGIGEPETLELFLDKIVKNAKKSKLFEFKQTVVIDSGIASKENLNLMTEKGLYYVAVAKNIKYPEDFWSNSIERKVLLKDNKTELTIKSERKDGEIFLYCYSPLKASSEASILKRRKESFEKQLKKMNENLSKPRGIKKYEKILMKIGRLKEKSKISYLYDITTVLDEKKEKVIEIKFKTNDKSIKKDEDIGRYVLRTNNENLSDEEITKIHRTLTTIEASFKSMKSDLGLRPVFHKKDENIKAHIFLSVLAYHFIIPIITKLREKNIRHSWSSFRKILLAHKIVTTSFITKENEIIQIRNIAKENEEQFEIYAALNLKSKPIKNKFYKEKITKK